ncbi:MAG: DUF998 domain-containing protein [Promethearchaeota archaeon]
MNVCYKLGFFDNIIETFLERMEPIYKVVPATSFGFAAVINSLTALLISFILYISVDPSFSLFTHWISHLGAGPNGSNIIFNAGICITSVLLFLFYMYFIKDFRKRGAKKILTDLFFLSTIGTCLGLFLVALFPYEIVILHSIAAFTFFISGLLSSILYAVLILITKGSKKVQALFALITTGFLCFHLIISIVPAFSIDLDSRIAVFSEWLSLFAMLALIIEVGFYHIPEQKLFYKRMVAIIIDKNNYNLENVKKLKKHFKALYENKYLLI